MNAVSITTDLVSAVYLLIIAVGINHVREANENARVFRLSVWVCFFGLLIDAMAYTMLERTYPDLLVYVANYLSYLFFDLSMLCYSGYLSTYVRSKGEKEDRLFTGVCILLCLAYLVFSTVGMCTGRLFSVENGRLVYGCWADYAHLLPGIFLFYCLIYLLGYRKKLGYMNLLILSSFLLLQLPLLLLWVFLPNIISGYVGYAIALTINFVLIQFRVIGEASMRSEVFNRLSVRDVLTGLLNRRAFEERIRAIGPKEKVCVIFCDVNGLKIVNDHFGHEEGDRLIQRMGSTLLEVFRDEEVFRISGDEFVVIALNEPKESSSLRIGALEERIREQDGIASLGVSTGEGADIYEVIKDAEKRMYLDKTDYYLRSGKSRRQQ